MKNAAYDDDNSILPLILGGGALAGIGYASYSALTDEEQFTESMTKVFNKIMPISKSALSERQKVNDKAFKAFSNGTKEGLKAAKILSEINISNKKSSIDYNNFGLPNFDNISSDFAIDGVKNPLINHRWSGSLDDMTTITGEKIGRRLEGSLIELGLGVRRGGVTFGEGTTLNVQTNTYSGKPHNLELHLPKFNDDLNVHVVNRNGRSIYGTVQGNVEYTKIGKDFNNMSIEDPLTGLVNLLEDPLEQSYHWMEKTYGESHARNVWTELNNKVSDSSKYHASDYQGKKDILNRELESIGRKNDKLKATLWRDNDPYAIQDIINRFLDPMESWKAAGNVPGVQINAMTVGVKKTTLIRNNDPTGAISALGNASSNADDYRRIINGTTKELNERWENKTLGLTTTQGKVIPLNKLEKKHNTIFSNFTRNRNQEQINDLVWGIGPVPTAMQGAEGLKGLTKEVSFHNLPDSWRTQPIIHNFDVEKTGVNVESLGIDSVKAFNAFLLVNPSTDENIMLRGDLKDKLKSKWAIDKKFKAINKNKEDYEGNIKYFRKQGDKVSRFKEGEKDLTLFDMLDEILADPEKLTTGKYSDFHSLKLNTGLKIGLIDYSEGMETYSPELMQGKMFSLKHDILVTKDDLIGMVQQVSNQSKTGNKDYFRLLGFGVDDPIKLQAIHSKTRSNITFASDEWTEETQKGLERTKVLNPVSGKRVLDGEISWSFFKTTLAKGRKDNGSINKVGEIGKNANEYLTFLHQSILGFAKSGKIGLEGQALKQFHSMLGATGETTEASFGRTIVEDMMSSFTTNSGVAFKQTGEGALKVGEHVALAEQFLGTIIRNRNEGNSEFRINKLDDLKSAAETINQRIQGVEEFGDLLNGKGPNKVTMADIEEKNSWFMMTSLSGAETEATSLGSGFNIYRVGTKTLHMYRDQPELLEEMGYNNLTDTPRIWGEGNLMMESLREHYQGHDIKSILPEGYNPQVLETPEDITKMAGSTYYLSDSNPHSQLSKPEIYKDSMFSMSGKNEQGFYLKHEINEAGDLGISYVPSKHYFQDAYYLSEKDRAAFNGEVKATANYVGSAFKNNGIVKFEDYKTYAQEMLMINGQEAKSGFWKRGAPHIDYALYSKNTAGTEFQNRDFIKEKIKNLGSIGEEAHNTIGHSVYISEDAVRMTTKQKLQNEIIFAEANNENVSERIKTIYGENNIFHRNMKYGSNGAIDVDNTINSLIEESHTLRESFEKSVNEAIEAVGTSTEQAAKERLRKTLTEVKQKSIITDVNRFPDIYDFSRANAFGFVADQKTIAKGKAISTGHILRLLENMDHDGDAIEVVMSFMEKTRDGSIGKIVGDQNRSYELFEKIHLASKGKILNVKEALLGAGEEELHHTALGIEGKDALLQKVEHMEGLAREDTALASYMTKALAGTMDVQTSSIRSFFMNQVKKGDYTNSESRELESWASNFFPKTIVQEALSSKHISIKFDENGQALKSKLNEIITNVAEVSPTVFKEHVQNMGGDIDALAYFTALSGTNSGAEIGRKELDIVDTLFSMQHNLRQVGEEEHALAARYIDKSGQITSEQIAERYKTYLGKIQSNREAGFAPVFESTDAMKKFWKDKKISDMILEVLSSGHKNEPNAFRALTDARGIVSTAMEAIQTGAGHYLNESIEVGSGKMLGQVSRRMIAGWDKIVELAKKHITPTKAAGALGLGLVTFTALNAVFGDSTPMNPNDMPSVNNPTFQDNRYNPILDQRSMNNSSNSNMSVGLLTDSHTPQQTVVNHLQSTFGNHYSTVSVRHDGQDPYKEHMYKYQHG